jgi:hypothetical protein
MKTRNFIPKFKNLLLICLILSTTLIFAQTEFQIAGIVSGDDGPLYQADIALYEHNEMINEVISGVYGEFSFKLLPNKTYTLMVRKKDHLPKKVQINTKVEKEFKRAKTMQFEIALNYFPDDHVDREDSESDFPFALITYDDKHHKLQYKELQE